MGERNQLSIIKTFVKFLDSLSARQVDTAIEGSTNKKYLSQFEVVEDFIKKMQSFNIINNEKAESFLKQYCNIDFTNSDTGSITGYDASKLNIKSRLNVLPGVIQVKKWTNPNQSKIYKINYLDNLSKPSVNREVFYSVIEGLTVLWDAYEDITTDNYSIDLKSKEFIIKGLNSTWIKYSLLLIEESLGISFNEINEDSLRGIISTDKLWVHFVNDGGISGSPIWIKSYFNEDKDDKEIAYNQKTIELHLYLNMFYLNNIDKLSPNGKIPDYNLTLDRLVAHELTHAVLSANIDYYKELPDYLSEGLAELVHGIDDIRKDAMIAFLRNYPNEIKQFYLTGELKGYITSNVFVNQFYHVAGYIFLRFMAEQTFRSITDEDTEDIIIADEIQKIIDDGELFEEEEVRESILIEIPTPLFATYEDAVKKINRIMMIQAGTYEILRQIEGYTQILVRLNNSNVSKINLFMGLEANFKIEFRQEFGLLDSITGWISNSLTSIIGNSFNNVNPSNTGTLSGFYNPASNSLAPVVKKNSHLVGYFSDYFDSYIMNLATTSIIEFHLPSELSDSMSANFESQNVRGRSAQYHGYNDSGPRNISFSIELQADYCKEEFNITIAKLKALTYPVYTNGVIYPSCVIKLGNVLTGQFIINSVGVSYDGQAPERDHLYTKATISIDAVETPQTAKSAEQIERDTNYFHSDGGIKSWFQNKVIGTLKDALGLSAFGL